MAALSGPGQKFSLSPNPLMAAPGAETEELPDAYGTGRLTLMARDPRCLYAHWDLTWEQQQRFNGLSAHRHLVIRLYLERRELPPISELHVHPESRHWFIHIEKPGAGYLAELGFYQPDGMWRSIAVSAPVQVPRDRVSEQTTVQFAVVDTGPSSAETRPAVIQSKPAETPVGPAAVPINPPQREERAEPIRELPPERPFPLPEQGGAEAWLLAAQPFAMDRFEPSQTERVEEKSREVFPAVSEAWSEEQERALAELIGWSLVRRGWPNSAELVEMARGQPEIPSLQLALLGMSAPGGGLGLSILEALGALGISSPAGIAPAPEKSFWFNVNAELVIYGATKADAQVTIGGRVIRLRPDGTFSYRFSLPDGDYQLLIQATASHGEERRAALEFHRSTSYSGTVEAHPQDPALKPPAAEHLD